jgi:hypothetical protein
MRRIASCLSTPSFSRDGATCDIVIIGNKIKARTTDRDLLPKDSVKKLGLFKIILLPKIYHPRKEIFIKIRSSQPPVPRIDQTYNNRVYNKISNIAREKFDLYQLGR